VSSPPPAQPPPEPSPSKLQRYLAAAQAFSLAFFGWVAREGQAVFSATVAQTGRLITYGKALWRSRGLAKTLETARHSLGLAVCRAGSGDAGVIERIAELSKQIESPDAKKAAIRPLKRERQELTLRLADAALAQAVSPAGVESEYETVVRVRASVSDQHTQLSSLRSSLPPPDGKAWRRVGFGYGTVLVVMLAAVVLALPSHHGDASSVSSAVSASTSPPPSPPGDASKSLGDAIGRIKQHQEKLAKHKEELANQSLTLRKNAADALAQPRVAVTGNSGADATLPASAPEKKATSGSNTTESERKGIAQGISPDKLKLAKDVLREAFQLAAAMEPAKADVTLLSEQARVLSEIAQLQAKVGDIDGAWQSVKAISPDAATGDLYRGLAIAEIAAVQAGQGDSNGAIKSADIIPGRKEKCLALAKVAEAQMSIDRSAAEQTFRMAAQVAKEAEDKHTQASCLEQVYLGRARSGDYRGAMSIAAECAELEPSLPKHLAALSIGIIQAKRGDVEVAIKTLASLEHNNDPALLAVVHALAEKGQTDRALAMLDSITMEEFKAEGLGVIALAQIKKGDNGGRTTLARLDDALKNIPRESCVAKSRGAAAIVSCFAELRGADAAFTAAKVTTRDLIPAYSAEPYWRIAEYQVKRGNQQEAESAFKLAWQVVAYMSDNNGDEKSRLYRELAFAQASVGLADVARLSAKDVEKPAFRCWALIGIADGILDREKQRLQQQPAATTTSQHSPEEKIAVDLGGSVSLEMVLIPAGEFMMGSSDSDRDALPIEKPQCRVRITKPFYLGVYEVTQAQYLKVMGNNPSYFRGESLPVESVSWKDAMAFCKRLSNLPTERSAGRTYRLPTEAEWEYACRAGTNTAYSFGDDVIALGDYAWCEKNANGTSHPIGQKKPNAWGLYDMHGNVIEWCADWLDFDLRHKSFVEDPVGPASSENSGLFFGIRDGSWGYGYPRSFRCAHRDNRGGQDSHVGFRVARTHAP
jgi:formylglycine-generating enzyme required for sulfatase activity/tetratricopeptide (TPR) repeat protein